MDTIKAESIVLCDDVFLAEVIKEVIEVALISVLNAEVVHTEGKLDCLLFVGKKAGSELCRLVANES